MLDHSVKALNVDDALNVEQLMIPICKSIGIQNHVEYSLVWENQPKVLVLFIFRVTISMIIDMFQNSFPFVYYHKQIIGNDQAKEYFEESIHSRNI